jgi:segregation and condensation protein B
MADRLKEFGFDDDPIVPYGEEARAAGIIPEEAALEEEVRIPAKADGPPLKGMIETVLFVTSQPLSPLDIAQIVEADIDAVEEAIMELMNDYAFRGDSAMEIDDTDGYILQIREEYKFVLDKMVPMELSQGALRTLSAIAIKAPVLQSDLVDMRGSSVYEHIPELLAKKLITKRREGRSYRLNVTKGFYEYFKLVGDKKELQIVMALMGREEKDPEAPAEAAPQEDIFAGPDQELAS